MQNPLVSRRQILTLAGLTLGVGVVAPAGPAAAAPADDVVLEPVADEPVAVLSGEGGAPAAVPRRLAVRLVRTAGLPAGAQIAITFDPRVHTPLPAAVVLHRGRPVPAATTTAADPATGLHTSTVTLTGAVPADGDLVAVVGAARPLIFPSDLVRRPAAPSARVATARRRLEPARPSSFGGPALPWGVEVDGVWAARSWGAGGRYRYYVPVRVSLTGTGPGRGPAAAFSVTLDPRLAGAVTVASARLGDRPYAGRIRPAGESRTASAYRTRWRAPAGLAAGEVLDVHLTVSTTLPAGPLTGVTHPVVAAVTTGAAAAQRHTGRETLSRTDSVCGDVPSG